MLNGRKWRILEAIIREYILSAEPVGSRSLTRRYDFGISAATIRNEMSDLEDLGYLEQPHTSAGRIPSDKGYRTFVDYIINSHKFIPDMSTLAEEIKRNNLNKKSQIHDLIKETTKMLADFTHYPSVGISPGLEEAIFHHIQLIPLSGRQVVVVLVTNSGIVYNRIISTSHTMDRKELGQISDFLNERLQGITLAEIDYTLMRLIEHDLTNRYDALSNILKHLYSDILSDVNQKLQKIFLDGTSYMIDQPEFADINKLKMVMNVLEQKDLLFSLLNQNEQGIQITIGQENPHTEMQDCSLISATYTMRGKPMGQIAILGPTRMEYGKIITMVQYTANMLSKILSEEDEA